jgi:phosphatidylglycerol---prolipoprotein diacylglyceryl transferase
MSSHSHRAERRKRFPYYSVMLYVGLVTALAVADRLARWSGVDPVRLVLAFLIAIPVCLAGARALDVVLNWSHYRARPREILRLSNGGAAMYGALPALLLLSIPLSRWIGVPLGLFWDAALASILAGMIPTRLGCLGAGCCAGRRTDSPFGMMLRDSRGARARRFPNPLFEALLGAVLLTASLLLWGRLPFPGALALAICAGYGAGRLALEELRAERPKRFAGLGALQWMSVALVVLGAGGLAAGWAGSHAPRAIEGALATDAPGALHLFLSSLLLLPVIHLFRFLGCDLIFKLRDPPVIQKLQMLCSFPALGTGQPTVTMEFLQDPGGSEISQSPIDLAPAGTEADGRLRFEALEDLPEGAYIVNCSVMQTDAITRLGTCSGELSGPDLVVGFNAALNSAPNELEARFCFDPI